MLVIPCSVAKMEVHGLRGQTISLPAERLSRTTSSQTSRPCTVTESYDWIEWSTDYSIISIYQPSMAYYWRYWDHRNLLHVWPFKAFHHDGSQVRIYWNQFLSESSMLAHQPCPVWNIHFIKKQKAAKGETAARLLEMGNILKHPKCSCVLSSQIKETLK